MQGKEKEQVDPVSTIGSAILSVAIGGCAG